MHTVDGDVELKIPALSRSGRKFLIKGRGAKKIDDPSGARGDHVVTLRVSLLVVRLIIGTEQLHLGEET